MPGAAVKKAQPSKRRLVRDLFFYEVCFLTLLEDCSEQRKPNKSGEIRPAGAAKKGDPITAPKAIANSDQGSFGLAKLGFSFVAEAIAQDKKDD
jgi:hypothetical protein